MYLPSHFECTDSTSIRELIDQYSFGMLIAVGNDRPEISHLPFRVSESAELVLEGHIARANPMAEHLDGGQAVAVFNGPHAYVSPTWYVSQGLPPTWNYAVVHVTGVLERVDDPEHLARLIEELADFNERAESDPWVPD